MQRYNFDRRYVEMFASVGVPMKELLCKAELPEDLFGKDHIGITSRTPVRLTKEEIFRVMQTLETLLPSKEAIVGIATWKDIEIFSPPVFAAYCSPDAMTCVERLSRYKRLVCPLIFQPALVSSEFYIEIRGVDPNDHLPWVWTEIEAAFVVNLIRTATGEHIVPRRVIMDHEVNNDALVRFMGCPIENGDRNVVVLSETDARRPFVSENEEMWMFFEPELKRRLTELQESDTMATRVRSALIELLPSGNCKVDDVAERLYVSRRTLQRRLTQEGSSFQQELNTIRKLMAVHYIKDATLQNTDIAFLLGYSDVNAFLRSFHTWTGKTVGSYREELGKDE